MSDMAPVSKILLFDSGGGFLQDVCAQVQVNVPWRHIMAVRKWVNVTTPPHPPHPTFVGR